MTTGSFTKPEANGTANSTVYTESMYTDITRTLFGPCVMIVRFWKGEIWLVMDEENKERDWV